MSHIKQILLSIFLSFSLLFITSPSQIVSAHSSNSIAFIVLSQYASTVDIGNEFCIIAITSDGSLPSWKSSNSKVASVNHDGKVTAKKAGTATITARIKNAKASCTVTVNQTKISIENVSSIERGETRQLTAITSNNSKVTWKSSKRSVATIDDNGIITGIKPGETTITAAVDGSKATCKFTVKSPTIKLNKSKITLYRSQTAKLIPTVSSSINPAWKTNKKSVAVVDEFGTITAVKHGTATITATVDGISKSCEVVVIKPVITLSSKELYLKKGDCATITANVSSGNPPTWSTSNSNIATIDTTGTITALKKGRAYLYAAEDGVKVRCILHVTE
jgi:uncharacterized protein YjdB